MSYRLTSAINGEVCFSVSLFLRNKKKCMQLLNRAIQMRQKREAKFTVGKGNLTGGGQTFSTDGAMELAVGECPHYFTC